MQPPGADDAAGRGERGRDLGGVVGEVVVDAHAAHLALAIRSGAAVPSKPATAARASLGRVPQSDEHPERTGGIERVVQAGDGEGAPDSRCRDSSG